MSETLLGKIPVLNKQIFDSAPIGMAISDFSGKLIRVNDTFVGIIGFQREELIGASFASFTHPDDLKLNLRRNKEVASGQIPYHQMEKRFIDKKGKILKAILKVTTLNDDAGKPLLLLAQVLDVTDREELISTIATSEQKFNEIFEEAAIPMAQSTLEGVIFQINKAFCKLLEYKRSELKGMHISQLSHPDDMVINKQSTDELVKLNKDSYSMEKRYITKSGKTIHTLLKVSYLRETPSNPSHLLGQIVDISEQKKYELLLKDNLDQLKKVNSELDSFIYRASHDLRGPLASLKGLINLRELSGVKDEIVSGMTSSVLKLENSIRELVEFSENSQKSVTLERIDVIKILDECIEMLSFHPNYSCLTINKTIEADLDFNSDLSRIKSLFNNLLSNSLNYLDKIKPENKVDITCKTSTDSVLIIFDDNGIGMNKRTLQRAKEMFYRGTEISNGSGLGLYLVNEIIVKLGGELELQSDLGKGTSITIILPK